MVYILEGYEDYKRDYEISRIVGDLPKYSFNSWARDVLQCWHSDTLLGKSVILLVLEQLEAIPELEKAICHNQINNDLIISFHSCRANLKLYKSLLKHGTLITCGKLEANILKTYISNALKKLELQMNEETYRHFVEFSGYYSMDEVNIYTINIFLKQLAFSGEEISIQTIDTILPKHLDTDVMKLSRLFFGKDHYHFMQLANDLVTGKSEPIALLGLLLRNFRIAKKIMYYPDMKEYELGRLLGLNNRQMLSMAGVRTCSLKQVDTCSLILQTTAQDIKKGIVNGKVAFIIAMGRILEEIS